MVNLIDSMIAVKKGGQSLSKRTEEVLTDIIKYQKLSRIDRYKDLTNFPNREKMLPNLDKALSLDPQYLFPLNLALEAVSYLDADLAQGISSTLPNTKQEKQLLIVSQNNVQVSYNELDEFGDIDFLRNEDYLCLTDDSFESFIRLALIVFDEKGHRVNTYVDTAQKQENTSKKTVKHYEPTTVNGVVINSLSLQGNNDYDFAECRGFHISMPNSFSLRYQKGKASYVARLTEEEVQSLSWHFTPEAISALIVKYFKQVEENKND